MTFKQRLALQVFAATPSKEANVTFPYGFHSYATVAAKCIGKKLERDAMYVGAGCAKQLGSK